MKRRSFLQLIAGIPFVGSLKDNFLKRTINETNACASISISNHDIDKSEHCTASLWLLRTNIPCTLIGYSFKNKKWIDIVGVQEPGFYKIPIPRGILDSFEITHISMRYEEEIDAFDFMDSSIEYIRD